MSGVARYLSLIDAGVSNLWSLSLPAHLENLNLHGNLIQHISNVSHLRHLVHFDLSANQITSIENLDGLICLKTLNLSCNLITVVEGLSSLRNLEQLDLSYNQIIDMQHVSSIPKLKYLSIHGNQLDNINDVIETLSGCPQLSHLTLSQDGSSNPLCSHQGYESNLRRCLPHLTTVNNTDISGNVIVDTALHNIPGLESYLEFLLSSNDGEKSTLEASSKNPAAILTPKIDAVMEQFKTRYGTGTDSSPQSQSHAGVWSSSPEVIQHSQKRKMMLSVSSQSGNKSSLRKSKQLNKGSSSDEDDEFEPVQDHSLKANKGRILSAGSDSGKGNRNNALRRSTSRERTSGGKNSSNKSKIGAVTDNKMGKQRQGTRYWKEESISGVGSTVRFVSDDAVSSKGLDKTGGGIGDSHRSYYGPLTSSDESKPRGSKHLVGKESDDRRKREDLETGYKELLVNLQTEKERRWKAEQATRRLADLLKNIHHKQKSNEEIKLSALETVSHLKQTILQENESNHSLKQENDKLKNKLESTHERIEHVEKDLKRSRAALKIAETTFAQMEGEGIVDKAHQHKKLQESNQTTSSLTREAELLRYSLDANKTKVEQLQETLASREQQHREEMKTRYSLNSPELKELIAAKVKDVERQQQGELGRQQERMEQLLRQYTDLENEFRQALTMEETRFRELKSEVDAVYTENMENKQLLLAAQRKDETSTNIIAELSALVKEQKGRITELAKSKQEQHLANRDRVERLEQTVEDMRRQLTQFESARQVKSKLQATVQAQESVIQGLKAERKVWGQELAQQGTSLAQDRGRLESKIETYTSEIAMLKKQLEREADAVKIKTKMIEDQTESIRKLKEAVVEREKTIKETRNECLTSQKDLEDQVSEMKAALDDSRDVLDRSAARKEELKEKVVSLEAELHDSKTTHSTLSARWKEKSELIGRLEQQVTQMRNHWSQKEAKVMAERDMALQQAKQAVVKLKSADVAFRQQLDVKEASCQERLKQAEFDKQQEVELANKKVRMVEEEMRDLLRENETSKKAMEAKMKKLTQGLGDLQSGLL